MEHNTLLSMKKSLEKSLVEVESLESAPSQFEKYSDDQGALQAFPSSTSPIHMQLPEVTSNAGDSEVHEMVKILTEKLSAALSNVNAKEDLAKQHAKVAEEAVLGWEQAETEVAVLKEQLEASKQKNSDLESRISDLDEALKECLRKLHQSREVQEQRVHDAITKNTCQWESERLVLEEQIVDLQSQLEDSKLQSGLVAFDQNIQEMFEAAKKENMSLKVELFARSKEIEVLSLERDLSNEAAEAASKQNLENIKKMAKLEADCRRLQSLAHRVSLANEHKSTTDAFPLESLTAIQSKNKECIPNISSEEGQPGSWATALIAELRQFKNEKAASRNTTTSLDVELMDDFLEMERLAALSDTDSRGSRLVPESNCKPAITIDYPINVDSDVLLCKLSELEVKIKRVESEKTEIEKALADSQSQLKASHKNLAIAENKLIELQVQLELANKSKHAATVEVIDLDEKMVELESQLRSAYLIIEKQNEELLTFEEKLKAEKEASVKIKTALEATEEIAKSLESQLESAYLDIGGLRHMVGLLESHIEEERELSSKFTIKVESLEETKKRLEYQLENAHLEVTTLKEKVGIFELKAEEERTLHAELASKASVEERTRHKLELQLELAHTESRRLSDMVDMLEGKIVKEQEISTELEAKCHKLESDLSRIKNEAELLQVSGSNGDLKIQKDKELALAAGKLEECQKTIASLSQHLKLLSNLEDYMIEAETLDRNGDLPSLKDAECNSFLTGDISMSVGNSAPPCVKRRDSPQSSPSISTLDTRLSSRSDSDTC